jgi:hypothetical protein
MNDLCQSQPDGKIFQLEPCAAAAAAKSELSIPNDNPLRTLCEEIFSTMDDRYHVTDQDGIYHSGSGYCSLFRGLKFNDDIVERIISSRLGENEDVANKHIDMCDIFGVRRIVSTNFTIEKGTLGKTWNAFIAKLIQFIKYEKVTKDLRECLVDRNKYIETKLCESMDFAHSKNVYAAMLAKKVSGAFLKAFDGAASGPPLSDFFEVREFARREEIILAFICGRIRKHMKNLHSELKLSTAAIAQERVELARCDKVEADADDINECCQQLALKFRGNKLRKKNRANVADALNQLLGCLDATVRKTMAETSFDFILEFDGDDNPERMEEMTMTQYFDALSKQWSEKPSANEGETNDEFLRRVEVNREGAEKLREEFLSAMDEKQVEEYLSKPQPIV